jgi:putative Holliday junction resolvase
MARLLGVDFGSVRVGLAVCDPAGLIATPLRTADARTQPEAVAAVADAVREVEAAGVVVGLPLNMDGTRGPMAERTLAFVAALESALDMPVETWDERLTTAQVERSLVEADLSRRKRRRLRDKLAARVILQSYLDAAGTAQARESDVPA